MKGSRIFIMIFIALFILYVVAELNRPRPVDWTITLSKGDKNPYGGFVLYNRLKDLFPNTNISAYEAPLYNQLNNSADKKSAYLVVSPNFTPSKNDLEELRLYVAAGNAAFIASGAFDKSFLDTFKLNTDTRFSVFKKDSTAVNLVNPALKASKSYTFLSNTIDEYFSKVDTAFTTILGTNDRGQANFIQLKYGSGSFYLHAAPICFSNYFILYQNNAQYTASVLSYLPVSVQKLYWDEFYKPNKGVPATPLRFILSNAYLLWALRVSLAGLLIYVLFETKRRQRIIPVVEPLRNSSLDFVRTISNVYFNQKDNAGIADKKISYFFDFIRQRYFIQARETDDQFDDMLARKSGVPLVDITELTRLIKEIQNSHDVSDSVLFSLDTQMQNFYKQV